MPPFSAKAVGEASAMADASGAEAEVGDEDCVDEAEDELDDAVELREVELASDNEAVLDTEMLSGRGKTAEGTDVGDADALEPDACTAGADDAALDEETAAGFSAMFWTGSRPKESGERIFIILLRAACSRR